MIIKTRLCCRRGVVSVFCTTLSRISFSCSHSASKCAFQEREQRGEGDSGHLVTPTCHRLKFCSVVMTFQSCQNNQPRQFVIGCRWDETECSCPDVRMSEQPLHKKKIVLICFKLFDFKKHFTQILAVSMATVGGRGAVFDVFQLAAK